MPKAREFDDDTLDRMNEAYWREAERWCWRRNIFRGNFRFELVRNNSPKNDINDDAYFEVTGLTKRECRDRHEAEMWLRAYRGRAAMQAALDAR